MSERGLKFTPDTLQKPPSQEDVVEKKEIEPKKGWLNKTGFSELLGLRKEKIMRSVEKYRASNPEWFDFSPPPGSSTPVEYYHPDLVNKIKEELEDFIRLRKETPIAPDRWMSAEKIGEPYGVQHTVVTRLAKPFISEHPEWTGKYKDRRGRTIGVYYHYDLVAILQDKLQERALVRDQIQPVPEGEGWEPMRVLHHEFNLPEDTLKDSFETYRGEHPEWFGIYKNKNGVVTKYYHRDLVQQVRNKFGQLFKDRREATEALPKWMHTNAARKKFGIYFNKLKEFVEPYRKTHPEWFEKHKYNGRMIEYLHPDLIGVIEKQFATYIEERNAVPRPPEKWKNPSTLAIELKVKPRNVWKLVAEYRETNPEWIERYRARTGEVVEYCHPDLVAIIRRKIKLKDKEERLPSELDGFVSEIAEGKSLDAQTFRSLINVFGPSRYLDILYKFRPEYKGLSVGYVKGIIAEYLGDFLILKGEFDPNDIEIAGGYLSDATLREGLIENIKQHCLHYYLQHKSQGQNAKTIIFENIAQLRNQLNHIAGFSEICDNVQGYYESLFEDFHKPEQFLDRLSEERDFPDVNQRINIKELSEKKKLLIADEMGVGKSASVIMAKENLGVKCAVIVAPSNVLETWSRYLSPGYKGGYYEFGKAPNALLVESLEDLDLEGVTEPKDYILISQERLNSKYVSALDKIDFDMLIVDEAHKIKSLEGRRTDSLLKLAEKISGNDQYLALLTGTPIPNKIEDIAVTLKLLYPEKFRHEDNKELAQKIIHGDLIDLRSLLIPRMQMKGLRESIDMPNLKEAILEMELSPLEKEVYEILIENDEITASEKIRTLRLFVMNPDTVDATPNLRSSKVEKLSALLKEKFTQKNRVVLFVNDYIENIIRGDKSILEKLNLPEDIEFRVVHGETDKEIRNKIQAEFNTPGSGKLLLVVSGQTADVGVDYSGAEDIIFYNEPWTEFQRRQELGRVYRPGLKHDLTTETILTNETLEEGIHEYISRKFRAVEKLLHGIPTTDLEKELLTQDEKGIQPDLSVTPELAEYYFSSWDKMVKIFRYVKEIGEVDLQKFLIKYGEDYARCYTELGNRSYQANANRIAGTMLNEFIKQAKQNPQDIRILDLASGPEMLKKHGSDELTSRIVSIDINPAHFAEGNGNNRVVGSLTKLPFEKNSFDYANLTFALHYSKFVPSRGELERLEVFVEMNRVLKKEGKAVIDLVYSLDFKDFESFRKNIQKFGFEIDENYTGDVDSDLNYKSKVITLKKVKDLGDDFSLEKLVATMDRSHTNGFKFQDIEGKLKDSRRIITSFRIGDREFQVNFNSSDGRVYEEEQAIIRKAQELNFEYSGIENIPAQEIIDNNFIRLLSGQHYILFKRLTTGPGGVVVK